MNDKFIKELTDETNKRIHERHHVLHEPIQLWMTKEILITLQERVKRNLGGKIDRRRT
jgi:hypothetical protein